MSLDRIGRLCRSILPQDFEKVRRRLPAVQQFLEDNLPQPMNRSVTLLTITPDEVVIAANSPLVANYLRLHSSEIQQQLFETFGLKQSLRFRSIPDTMLQVAPATGGVRKPEPVGKQSVEALRRNARWIEDEELREAMLSLAARLESDTDDAEST